MFILDNSKLLKLWLIKIKVFWSFLYFCDFRKLFPISIAKAMIFPFQKRDFFFQKTLSNTNTNLPCFSNFWKCIFKFLCSFMLWHFHIKVMAIKFLLIEQSFSVFLLSLLIFIFKEKNHFSSLLVKKSLNSLEHLSGEIICIL